MGYEKLVTFLESSFLKPMLNDEYVTDISFNGLAVFYMHTLKGRIKSSISLTYEDVSSFLRQISNLAEKQFSFQNPILDVAFGKYRLNAIHHSICRFNNQPTFSFSLRITSYTNHWENSPLINTKIKDLLKLILNNKQSIVIGGKTSCGKTEFQKYIISLIKTNSRLIIIDNVLELDGVNRNEHLDITSWQADDRNSYTSIQSLVKNALRNNPDWVVIAEARGEEMLDVLNSAMTGHPIITTLHAQDVNAMPSRMISMILMNQKKISDSIYSDLYCHFHFYIYLSSFLNDKNEIIRYVSSILYIDGSNKKTLLFSSDSSCNVYYAFPKSMELLFSGIKEYETLKEKWVNNE